MVTQSKFIGISNFRVEGDCAVIISWLFQGGRQEHGDGTHEQGRS